MTNDEMKNVIKSMAVLFSSFPQSALANIDMQTRSYADAVKDYEASDILAAVDRFRHGEVANFEAAFCPSSAQLCIEVRRHRDIRASIARRKPDLKLVAVLPPSHFQNRFKG